MSSAAAVLVCALSLLSRTAKDMPPIELVDVAPPEVSRFTEGFVRHDPDTIYLLTSSSVFRLAEERIRDGCTSTPAMKKLASILVHEQWHLRNGSDERGAYYAQLTTLASLGVQADNTLYVQVTRAMLAVTRGRERASKAEMLVAEDR